MKKTRIALLILPLATPFLFILVFYVSFKLGLPDLVRNKVAASVFPFVLLCFTLGGYCCGEFVYFRLDQYLYDAPVGITAENSPKTFHILQAGMLMLSIAGFAWILQTDAWG
jgi:hypothetical protein